MQRTINIQNLTVSFPDRVVLDGISFRAAVSERICVVGENGGGKSTFLKVIAGIYEPTAGRVDISKGVRTLYVPQEFPTDDQTKTVEEFIKTYASPQILNKVVQFSGKMGLALDPLFPQKCSLLSGGQQKILSISVALAQNPDFLLLDEPENHLDIVTRQELISLLQEYKNGIIFISHDKNLMDQIALKVAEITHGKLFISEGGYDDYIAARENRIGGLQRTFDTEEKRIKQLEKALVVLGQKAFRGKEVSLYNLKKKELAELKQSHKDNPRARDEFTQIKLRGTDSKLHNGKVLIRVKDLTFKFPDAAKNLFYKLNFELRVGSHIVLLGRNGSGKSTFLKLLEHKLAPTGGEVEWTEGVRVRYFDQHMSFDPDQTGMAVVQEVFACKEERARQILGSVKFSPEQMTKKTSSLSGGEKMRLKFAITFGGNPDVIVLDEPTNHLDITTWQILLDNCNSTSATIILVTHDQEFLDEIENKRFLVISSNQITQREKDLDQLIEELRAEKR